MKSSEYDGLNCLGAGLLTAIGAHGLLCVAALPGLFTTSHESGMGLLFKGALILWTLLGIPAAAYVGIKSAGLFNGRNYSDARCGAIGTMFLPLLGQPGAVTAFALVPAGIMALVLLKRQDWRVTFQPEPVETQCPRVDTSIDATAREPEFDEALR